jgi:hypothetical protein
MIRHALLAAVFAGFAAGAYAVQLSSSDPTLLRFAADPQFPVFAPGSAGRAAMHDGKSYAPPTRGYNEETQTQGQVLPLYADDYDFRPCAADAESTQPAGYWLRIGGVVGEGAHYGIMTDCRVTSALSQELRKCETTWTDYARRFARNVQAASACVISLDLPYAEAMTAKAAFKNLVPNVMVGLACHKADTLPGARDFDFVIADESALPPAYQGQAAMSFIRSRVGSRPVIMASVRPQLHKELVWLATGAAAIQYERDFSPTGSPAHKIEWRNVRAISSVPHRFAGKFHLDPAQMQRGLIGVVSSDSVCAYLPLINGDFDLALPSHAPDRPEYISSWYNPISDENIILPRVRWPSSGKLRLKTPSADPWIYFHAAMPKLTDEETTITLIVPEPPEPLEPDDTAAQTSGSRSTPE